MKFLKAAALVAVMWLAPAAALAQSSPGWPFGYVPTAAEWNAAFATKSDFTGSSPIPSGGGTFTGKVNLAPSTAGTAGLNCGVGTAPSSPINGDVWCTSAGMFIYAGGMTIGPFGAGGGGALAVSSGGTGVATIPTGQVMIGQGTSPIITYPRSGTGTTIATTAGTLVNGQCVTINSTLDLVASGAGCGAPTGSIGAATVGQLAVYTGSTALGGTSSISTAISSTITTLGTVTSGTWQGSVIAGTYGGTGVNNGINTISLNSNNFAITGGAITLTAIGATNVTLPTTGTLMSQNGTSGGIPYYNTTTSTQSSGLLTANLPVLGGGAGAAPFSGTRQGNTTTFLTYSGSAPGATNNCAAFDNSGATANVKDSGAPCAGATGGAVLLTTLTVGAGTCSPTTVCTDVGAAGCAAGGCFTASYPSYTIRLINLVAPMPAGNIICQLQVYQSSTFQNAGYVNSVGSTAYIPCGVSSGSGNSFAAPGVSGTMTVFNPSAAAKAMWVGLTGTVQTNGTSIGMLNVGGWWNTSGVVTGFRVFFGTTAGVPTTNGLASGIIEVYGNP